MNTTEQYGPAPTQTFPPRKLPDEILEELWEIKRQLNASADYDVAILAARANQFDIDAALAALNTAARQAG